MEPNELCYQTIVEAAAGLRRKDLSPHELTEAALKRIESIDDKLHCFITLTADLALRQAEQAEQDLRSGQDRGPLHGIPIALKDLYMTQGIRTTCHSAVLKNWVPDNDATAATKLREAGAILLAKLACTNSPSVDRHWTLPSQLCAIPGIRLTYREARAAAPALLWPQGYATAPLVPTLVVLSARRPRTAALSA